MVLHLRGQSSRRGSSKVKKAKEGEKSPSSLKLMQSADRLERYTFFKA